jgi:hypothetical protein
MDVGRSLPGVGTVTTDDIVDSNGAIDHDEVGRRLAEWALSEVYGQKSSKAVRSDERDTVLPGRSAPQKTSQEIQP